MGQPQPEDYCMHCIYLQKQMIEGVIRSICLQSHLVLMCEPTVCPYKKEVGNGVS